MRRVSDRYDRRMPSSLVDHRRVDEEEHLLAARRAGLRHQLERLLHQRLGQLARVGNRRRRADEGGIRAVVPAHAAQPAQHVGEMAAEHAAIGVQLVDHHVAQVLEQLRPARMVRQDARVDHVGIAQHHVRAAADGAARVLRRVAVVGEDADLQFVGPRQPARQLVQLGQLVLRQRLGRKEIQRAAGRVPQDGAEHRRVVAERLARRGGVVTTTWRPAVACAIDLRLMAVSCSMPRAASTSRSRASTLSGKGAKTAGTAGCRRTAVIQPSGVSARVPGCECPTSRGQHRVECDVVCRRGPLGGQHGRRI